MNNRLKTLLLLMAVWLVGCSDEPKPTVSSSQQSEDQVAPAPASTIEKLYAVPSIIGTSPEGFAWSQDSNIVAFLWNKEGQPFRDVWTYSVSDGALDRITHHGDSQPEDAGHEGVSQVVWLGDSERLAYVLDGDLYLTGSEDAPRLLTDGDESVRDVRYSAASGYLSYVADGNLWIQDIDSGNSPRQLFDSGHPLVSVERYQWSEDGQQIAFVSVDNRDVRQIEIDYDTGGESRVYKTTRAFPGDQTPKRRTGIVHLDNGKTKWFERPDAQHPIWGFGLSPDGKRLFVDSSDFVIKERTIYVYDTSTSEREIFYQFHDPKKVMPRWSAAWAPDSEGLIILSDKDGYFHLYHKVAADESMRQLTKGDWEISSFDTDATNDLIYFLANESHPAELQVYRVPVAGGDVERMSRRPGTHAPVFSPDFELAADRISNDVTPPDLYINELQTDAPARQATVSPQSGFDQLALADVSYVEFKSHIDDAPLIGRLSVPPNFDPERKYPLLMGSIYPNSVRNRWGAGNAIPTWGLDQHLVERGYLLMKVDVRGSWGYGKKMRQGLFRDYGGIDKDDVESGLRHLIEQGFVDPDRVGIWGWSYGGLMTLMSLFHKPDVYAVGIADAPATNVAHAFPEQMWVMGRPDEPGADERYKRMSALYHSEGLTEPLMITHATKDAVVLYGDTIALAERLIAGGKLFELVTLPGSSHVWANDSRDQQIFGYRKMVKFFDRHLEPEL